MDEVQLWCIILAEIMDVIMNGVSHCLWNWIKRHVRSNLEALISEMEVQEQLDLWGEFDSRCRVVYMDYGSNNMTAALTVAGNITNNGGTLSLSSSSGGDINANGDFTQNSTFNHNSRTIILNGSSAVNKY